LTLAVRSVAEIACAAIQSLDELSAFRREGLQDRTRAGEVALVAGGLLAFAGARVTQRRGRALLDHLVV
jgi:hypothetical protein